MIKFELITMYLKNYHKVWNNHSNLIGQDLKCAQGGWFGGNHREEMFTHALIANLQEARNWKTSSPHEVLAKSMQFHPYARENSSFPDFPNYLPEIFLQLRNERVIQSEPPGTSGRCETTNEIPFGELNTNYFFSWSGNIPLSNLIFFELGITRNYYIYKFDF